MANGKWQMACATCSQAVIQALDTNVLQQAGIDEANIDKCSLQFAQLK